MTSIQQRDAQSVLAAIDDLLPRLRERNQETEDLRRLPDATIADLDAAGYFKMLQPEPAKGAPAPAAGSERAAEPEAGRGGTNVKGRPS